MSKRIAWEFTPFNRKETLKRMYKELDIIIPNIHLEYIGFNKRMKKFIDAQGLCGGSGGLALVIAIYGLFNGIRIKKDQGFTGKIISNGDIKKIKHLDIKLLGGIRAGIFNFFIPMENKKEMETFLETYIANPYHSENISKLKYTYVSNVKEIIEGLQ